MKLAVAAEQMAHNGAKVLALPCDIRRRDQLRSLGKATAARLGTVRILVNNAGVARAVNFTDMPDDLWDETLETNLTGAYNCCKVFWPAMAQEKWGRILNVASTTAKVGYSQVTDLYGIEAQFIGPHVLLSAGDGEAGGDG